MKNARKTDKISRFHHMLHRWYAAYGRRDLPWRNTRDPYAIYLSEIMLQQTQVKTVLAHYYFPFLQQFPTLQTLADAPRDDVLKAWEGLGYYNRAANLHKTAHIARNGLPDRVEALMALPGIGRNTAHAVAAFAFRLPVPVMEANVKRVLSRIFALEDPATETLWHKAFALLDTKQAFDYNQAMMDIGAKICTPRNPACVDCPATEICLGKTMPEYYPAKKAKISRPIRKNIIVIQRDSDGRLYLERREGAFLRGLYGFGEAVKVQGIFLGHVQQAYSHFQAQSEVWLQQLPTKGQSDNWFVPESIACLALSGIDKKAFALIKNNQKTSIK